MKKKKKNEPEINKYIDDILILVGLLIMISVSFVYNILLGFLIIGFLSLLIGLTLADKKKWGNIWFLTNYLKETI